MLDGMNIGALSYSLAAILYLAFAGFLIIRWQGRLQGAIILLATLATVVWAAFAGYAATTSNNQVYMFVLLLECMRDLLWLTFLLQLLGAADSDNDFNIKYRTIIIGMFALVFFQSFVLLYYVLWGGIVSEWLWVHFLALFYWRLRDLCLLRIFSVQHETNVFGPLNTSVLVWVGCLHSTFYCIQMLYFSGKLIKSSGALGASSAL